MDGYMSEIEFTEREKIRLKQLANMDSIIYPSPVFRNGLLDWCIHVCKFYNISVEEFKSPKRDKHLFRARVDFTHIILNYVQRYNGNQIAKFMNRDHTTILHQKRQKPFAAETIYLENNAS